MLLTSERKCGSLELFFGPEVKIAAYFLGVERILKNVIKTVFSQQNI